MSDQVGNQVPGMSFSGPSIWKPIPGATAASNSVVLSDN